MFARIAVLLLVVLATATAFAPQSFRRAPVSNVLKMSFENEIGVLPPVGYWDPLGKFPRVLLEVLSLPSTVVAKSSSQRDFFAT